MPSPLCILEELFKLFEDLSDYHNFKCDLIFIWYNSIFVSQLITTLALCGSFLTHTSSSSIDLFDSLIRQIIPDTDEYNWYIDYEFKIYDLLYKCNKEASPVNITQNFQSNIKKKI